MKAEKRKELKRLRDNIQNKALLDRKISQAFLSSELYRNADTLLLYYSVGSEASTKKIFETALSDGKKVAFPVCLDSEGAMEFFLVKGEKELTDGRYNIKQPCEACEKFTSSPKALCIVPGLSFDREGYRIGYGKGYYDRFLSRFDGISVGLCYDELLSERLPTDTYDKQVNYLITDKKVYKFFKEDLKDG